ncbi:MAG: hypothetical protein QN178_06840 [Armatimonadota bacterium]|nr:hypothetical protein [Armatimonadota bacterium]
MRAALDPGAQALRLVVGLLLGNAGLGTVGSGWIDLPSCAAAAVVALSLYLVATALAGRCPLTTVWRRRAASVRGDRSIRGSGATRFSQ